MVVFTCSTCGESLKKNQVEKHYQTKCRNCEVLSCVDCGKDFWGDDYQQHTKCISEEEKYSGKNYVPKPNANKGEVKQGQWLQQVQGAIEKCKTNARLKNLLERMKEYPNIPRKKAKFENFLGNSLNVRDKTLTGQVWELLMANTQQNVTEQQTAAGSGADKTQSVSQEDDREVTPQQDHREITPAEETTHKASKREKKELRRKEKHKKEKKDKNCKEDVECEQVNGIEKERRKKKRKYREDGEEEMVTGPLHTCSSSETEVEPRAKKRRVNFDWAAVIMAVVSKKGQELSLKKVRKKVIAEYLAQGGIDKSEEKLWSKLEKKIKKNPQFHLHKDRVKIVLSR